MTREQLLVVVAEQARLLDQQGGQIQALTEQVAELTRLLGRKLGQLVDAAVDGPRPRTSPATAGLGT